MGGFDLGSARNRAVEPWPEERRRARPATSALDVATAQALADLGATMRRLQSGPGEQEAQLKLALGPFFHIVVGALGMRSVLRPEVRLLDERVRPDFALDVGGHVVGYVEVKKPERGADPRAWTPRHRDSLQWAKLRQLPNVLYTDGNQWAVYHHGVRSGEIGFTAGDVRRAGPQLASSDGRIAQVLKEFAGWRPRPPRSVKQLVRVCSGLCQLLRDEVLRSLQQERRLMRDEAASLLVRQWRETLFPDASDHEFADGYAQTVTFALLLARMNNIDCDNRAIREIAHDLGVTHSLMGEALDILAGKFIPGFEIPIDMLRQVIGAVDWNLIQKTSGRRLLRDTDRLYWEFYEAFLEAYDPDLRRMNGSYYTPREVVSFMVQFTDYLLRNKLGRPLGFASPDVVTVDPAMGTGAFLASIVKTVASTVRDEEGETVPAHLSALADRLIGFEKQMGPFAVAEWRIRTALRDEEGGFFQPDSGLTLLIADTLADPYAAQPSPRLQDRALVRSRREADRIKRDQPVLVVIGNPPYGERARGKGLWIERGDPSAGVRAPLDDFRLARNGRYENKLLNLYVYFWRWGTWKAFDAHPTLPSGIVAFISTAGYLSGPGFAGMRRYLRAHADEGWIIDLSPEGHRPDGSTRVFQSVQRQICIGIFVRVDGENVDAPAQVHYHQVSGSRLQKLEQLARVSANSETWKQCPVGWEDPFLPESGGPWREYPVLGDLMPWSDSGVKPNRTWVYAPKAETLQDRWARLIAAPREEKAILLKQSDDRTIFSRVSSLPGMPPIRRSIADETSRRVPIMPVALRSFDRQWIIADNRVIDRARPELWEAVGPSQVFISEQHVHPITGGPALTFSARVPDMHCYNGRGGRVLPLFRDADGSAPNLMPGLLSYLSQRLDVALSMEDIAAYIACLVAHSGYTRRFRQYLSTGGTRVPLTLDRALWADAVGIGRRVLWLHTFGERFGGSLPASNAFPPELPSERRPKVLEEIPHTLDDMPNSMEYDSSTQTLRIGRGTIGPVHPAIAEYEVSGMRVIRKWFGYRKKRPDARWSSPLNEIRAQLWSDAMGTELLNLLKVLDQLVALEPAQDRILGDVCGRPVITVADLMAAKMLPVPLACRNPPARSSLPSNTIQQSLPWENGRW